MNRIALLLALCLITPAVAFSDETSETTKTTTTDGKKTTKSHKMKHSADAAGNSEVKAETVEKTENSKKTGAGGETSEEVRTHNTEGKKTRESSKVTHKAGAAGDEVKTETTGKTEVK